MEANHPNPHKFVVLTPPKCGTHLIGKLMESLSGRYCEYMLNRLGSTEEMVAYTEDVTEQGGFVVGHCWSFEMLQKLVDKDYRVILMIRDPRDQVLSMQDWMQRGEWSWIKAAHIQDPEEQLRELITGDQFGWTCHRCIIKSQIMVKALGSNHGYITKFETLVGPKGGGCPKAQALEFQSIAKFLNIPLKKYAALRIGRESFGGSTTFNKGQKERWRQELTEEHKTLFLKRYKKELKALRYPVRESKG